MLKSFKSHYRPAVDCTPASEETIRKYEDKIPESLMEIWKLPGSENTTTD